MAGQSEATAAATGPGEALAGAVGQSWRGFLEVCEPLRPELYRYCRYLTRSPWDADDLVQDALARAFVTLGCLHQPLENPRAWLFRVASNVWLNRVRDRRELPTASSTLAQATPETAADEPQAMREAAGTLIGRLAPQERAAVVLKDVFDLSLEEVALALSTSVGAVKAALHRGRGKLLEPEPAYDAAPVPAVLDAFCEAFNARDLNALTALLLDSVVSEFPGLSIEYGAETARRGSLAGVLFGDPSGERSPIGREYRTGLQARPPRLELRVHRGEALLLGWFLHNDGEAVRAISRVAVSDDRVARIATYMHAPEVLAEICSELDVPFRSSGYRYW
jgi:RNA polymerase sigma-70 factor (ECF subfamily)